MAKKQTDTEPALEIRLKELEQLVAQLEKGDISLEQSLASFEKGVKLVASCQKTLADTEQKVKILMKDELEPFNTAD